MHDFIKEFNAIERVRLGPVAHPQDTRSTLSLSLSFLLTACMPGWFGWLFALLTQNQLTEERRSNVYLSLHLQVAKVKVVARAGHVHIHFPSYVHVVLNQLLFFVQKITCICNALCGCLQQGMPNPIVLMLLLPTYQPIKLPKSYLN